MEKEKKVKEEKEEKEEKTNPNDFAIEEKSQKNLKTISKIISVFAKIGEVFSIIGIVGIVIAMITVPIITSNIKVSNSEEIKYVEVFGQQVVYERTEDKISFYLKDDEEHKTEVTDKSDVVALGKAIDFIEDKNLSKIAIIAEVYFVLIIAVLVVTVLELKKVYQLFKNINEGNTPFTKENNELLRSIGKYLLIIFVISFVMEMFTSMIFDTSSPLNITTISEILFVYCIIYIFEYGFKLQKATKGRIYSE